jgi:hypothetical protein
MLILFDLGFFDLATCSCHVASQRCVLEDLDDCVKKDGDKLLKAGSLVLWWAVFFSQAMSFPCFFVPVVKASVQKASDLFVQTCCTVWVADEARKNFSWKHPVVGPAVGWSILGGLFWCLLPLLFRTYIDLICFKVFVAELCNVLHARCMSSVALWYMLFAGLLRSRRNLERLRSAPRSARRLWRQHVSICQLDVLRGSCGSDKAACLKEKVCALSSDPQKSAVCN